VKAYLWVSGTLFTLFAAMHFVIAYERWRRPATALWEAVGPALIGIFAAALAAWAYRLGRPTPGSRGA
jgi:hypothetical protein